MTRLLLIALALLSLPVSAEVMQSSNYSIERDSLNFGGGLSNSSNYAQESTFGEVATGDSGSASYRIRAGYQQMDAVFLSMSSVADVVLTPALDVTVGGVANGSTAVTITTDNPAGYELFIHASSSPALVSSLDSFADYTPAGLDPDFLFAVASADSEFGFTVEGSDVDARFLDDGTQCGVGALDTTDRCWAPLATSPELIAGSASANVPSGSVTTLKFRAELGSSHVQQTGSYTATSTVTAVSL